MGAIIALEHALPSDDTAATSSATPLNAEVIAAWPIAAGALLIAVRSGHVMAHVGVAQLERRRADRGPFRALSWPLEGANGTMAVVIAVRLNSGTTALPGQALRLEGENGAVVALRLPPELTGAQGFASAAARLVANRIATGARLARFLSATFPQSAFLRLPAIGMMFATLLAEIASDDGCIELLGALPGAYGFLQGWGGQVVADRARPGMQAGDNGVQAVLVGERVSRCRMHVATFARHDIRPPAAGAVLVVAEPIRELAEVTALSSVENVYLLTESAVLRRSRIGRNLLNETDSHRHMLDLLPSLACPPTVLRYLRSALRPRYEGRETLGEQPWPVRMAVDQALLLPVRAESAGGIYLEGWLFDPADQVCEVNFRSTEGFAVRVDSAWIRVPRADVSVAMSCDGVVPSCADDAHGFTVYAEFSNSAEGAHYLEVNFRDGSCAFLPVTVASACDVAARERVIAGTDLHKPSGIAIVERALGPLFLALFRRRLSKAPRKTAVPVVGAAVVALIVDLTGPAIVPRSLLSQFLHDAPTGEETLVLVCGGGWNEGARAALRRVTNFMGLSAHVLHAPEAADASAALDVAFDAIEAEFYLLMAPGIAGRQHGWRAVLLAAARSAATPSVVCPTLAYEDHSIRYAGSGAVTNSDFPPYANVQRRLAGMPLEWVEDGPPRPTIIGTLSCCLVPRSALVCVVGAETSLATAFGRETALFLRLRAAGIPSVWAPGVRVFAPESTEDGRSPGRNAVGRLIDGWCLRASEEAGLFSSAASAAVALEG